MNLINDKLSPQKLRGGYYTPKGITEFLCNWCIKEQTKKVLEPSCGDGNFIEAAIKRFIDLEIEVKDIKERITGIELIKEEAAKAKKRAKALGVDSSLIINNDFFHFVENNKDKKYDAIIGNPPFIRYQNFPEEHRELANEMMQHMNLHPNKLMNIWVPFLIVSTSLLSDDGKLAMVIPAELFQVKYAAETRVYLSQYFERVTIITFKKLVFPDIQQEVVLLLCEKQVDHGKGIRVIECEDVNGLCSIDFVAINGSNVKPVEHSSEKWTKYFLDEDEIMLLKRLKHDTRVIPCNEIFETQVGLVTGRNQFFMMKEEDVSKWNLQKYTIPVVSKSNQLKGLIFSEHDFLEISNEQKPIFLFLPPDVDFDELPETCKKYVLYGQQKGFDSGYKTRIRKRWYITPSRWAPDAFALRQVGKYPKIVLNDTGAASTDTIHRVKFKEKVDKKMATIAFINSLTFASSEIIGRSYGGGVMTFEPSEISEILIPRIDDFLIDFNKVDGLMREKRVEEAMDIIDKELLIKHHGFTENEVKQLRTIWEKLSLRRVNRKK